MPAQPNLCFLRGNALVNTPLKYLQSDPMLLENSVACWQVCVNGLANCVLGAQLATS